MPCHLWFCRLGDTSRMQCLHVMNCGRLHVVLSSLRLIPLLGPAPSCPRCRMLGPVVCKASPPAVYSCTICALARPGRATRSPWSAATRTGLLLRFIRRDTCPMEECPSAPWLPPWVGSARMRLSEPCSRLPWTRPRRVRGCESASEAAIGGGVPNDNISPLRFIFVESHPA